MNGYDRRARRRRHQRRQRIRAYVARTVFGLVLLALVGFVGFGCIKVIGLMTKGHKTSATAQVKKEKNKNNSNSSSSGKSGEMKKDVIVVVDAGHGGRVPGCVFGDIMEKDIALSVALKLQKELEQMGMMVIMTREDDSYPRLSERVQIANDSKADYFVSIHCNSYEDDATISGLESYYCGDNGSELAQKMIEAARRSNLAVEDAKYGNFQVLRETKMPATLVEIGYMTNPAELELMCSESYQDELASVVAKGIQMMAGEE